MDDARKGTLFLRCPVPVYGRSWTWEGDLEVQRTSLRSEETGSTEKEPREEDSSLTHGYKFLISRTPGD